LRCGKVHPPVHQNSTPTVRHDPSARIPRYARAYLNRSLTYSEKGDYDRAIVDYSKIIEINPQDACAHYDRGVAYVKKGEERA
jgi:tetratricopeptide (TPR) repeat protein